jgi:DNA-binding GntR family transcriptional regulator
VKISDKELYKSPLLKIMEQKLDIHFTEALQMMEATFANQEVAGFLGISPGSPSFILKELCIPKGRNRSNLFNPAIGRYL